ncbi:MAG: hypothetical protein M0006_02335 [Magnetospirillum sp.]|nr:hypothetical protein [Magnetospirillum sp.]
MKNRSLVGAATSFAHLLGIATAKKAEEEDRDGDEPEGSEDETEKDGEDEDESGKKKSKKKAKRTKSGDDEGGDDADDADTEGDEDGGDEEDAKSAAGRQAERARCARILAHGIQAGRVEQAGVLAFDTSLTASAAIAVLNAAAATEPRREGLGTRMGGVRIPNPGADASGLDPNDPQGIAARIVAAAKKARGEA